MAEEKIVVDGYELKRETERDLYRALREHEKRVTFRDGKPKRPLDEAALRQYFEHLNGLEGKPLSDKEPAPTHEELEGLRDLMASNVRNLMNHDPNFMREKAVTFLIDSRRLKRRLAKPSIGHDRAYKRPRR